MGIENYKGRPLSTEQKINELNNNRFNNEFKNDKGNEDRWITVRGQHIKVDKDGNPVAGNPKALGKPVTVEKEHWEKGYKIDYSKMKHLDENPVIKIAPSKPQEEKIKSTSKLPFVRDFLKDGDQRDSIMSKLSSRSTETLNKALDFMKGHSDEDTLYLKELIKEELKSR